MRRSTWLCCVLTLSSAAASDLASRAVSILNKQCGQCHNASTAMSGLRLDTREHTLKGGGRGPAIVPGDPANSLLFKAVRHEGKLVMPPGKPIAAEDQAALKSWIEAGAPWSGEPKQETAKFWSFQKPVRPPVPAINDPWVRNPIDAFVLAKLRSAGMKPSPEADRHTLNRRAYYDLHGLPPTYEQARGELNVDSLLASERYGEKWGRHWLDLVRYGDTSGFEQDPYQLDAYRYRDYVIKSFNEDKPYDRFVKEQIAGDELYADDPESMTGTGYYTVGPNRDMLFKVEDINKVESLADWTDTTGSVFLGLSVGCARCHDHKFDPIPQRDYYRMQAIFAPMVKTRVFLQYDPARSYDLAENTRTFQLREIADQLTRLYAPHRKKVYERKLAGLPENVREAFLVDESKRTVEQKQFVETYRGQAGVSDDELRAAMSPAELSKLQAIEKRLVRMFAGFRPGPFAPGVMDAGREAPRTYVPVRSGTGLGQLVGPGFLTAIGGGDVPEPAEDATSTGRRKALAEWIANKDNPLTARVIVNRIWQHHFGRGLVATSSDFGTRGAAPSHPELLDWLAVEFMESGWSMKKLHKLIMSSSTYRQASKVTPEAQEKDPENALISHFSRRRLQSEEIRDSILQASGALNLKMGGRPVVTPLDREEMFGMNPGPDSAWVVTDDKSEHGRRSVYLLSRRVFRQPMMEVFDLPDGTAPCPRRDNSTSAPQSLSLLNSSFTVDQAGRFAASIGDTGDVVAEAWRRALGRDPDTGEREASTALIGKHPLTELGRGLFNLNEFLYVD